MTRTLSQRVNATLSEQSAIGDATGDLETR